MTDVLLPVAVKFLEEGGAWVILGAVLLIFIAIGYIVVALFNRYVECQDARIRDTREMMDKTLTAMSEVKATIDAATRAAEFNAKMSEANKQTTEGLKELLLRAVIEDNYRGHK